MTQKTNNSRDKMIEDIIDNKKFLTPESDMNFKCNVCGKCCHNQDIILSTLDIVRLRRGLNLPTPAILKNYVTIHKGHNSGLSVCMLKFKQIPYQENITICPFLKPEFHKEVEGISKENKTEEEYMKEVTKIIKENFDKGKTKSICSIHNNRPEVCRLYPLGRGFIFNKDTKKYSVKFFEVDRKTLFCDKTCFLHKNKVKDYLGNNQIPEYQEIQEKFNASIIKLAEVTSKKDVFSEEDYAKIVSIFYNFDSVLMLQFYSKVSKEKLPESAKENLKKMQDLYEDIPKLDKNILTKTMESSASDEDVKKTCYHLIDIQAKVINNLVNKYAKRDRN